MRYFSILAFFCFVMLSGCNTNTCSVSNPAEDLDWLAKEIQTRNNSLSNVNKYLYISQSSYHGETVFIFGNCCDFCDLAEAVYDCSGEKIGNIGAEEGEVDYSVRDNAKYIWKPVDFVCEDQSRI